MSYSSTIVSPELLQKLATLLQCAVYGHDNQSQKKVYDELTHIEENPISYIGFAHIAASDGVQINLRQMALITLKSALKRNQDIIQFTIQQLTELKNLVFRMPVIKNQAILSAQRSVISQLCRWNRGFDYGILFQILNALKCEQYQWAIDVLYTILEDIRFQTQNMTIYETPQFSQFLNGYTQIFAQKINCAESDFANKLIGCMNLTIKYMNQNHQICGKYLQCYLIPILRIPTITNEIIIQILDGITQLIENGNILILKDTQCLETVLHFQGQNVETMKRWVSLVLDIVDAQISEEETLKKYLPFIVPKIVRYLEFTQEDELNVKMEMEQQINPYQYEQDEADEEDNNFDYANGQRGHEGGYTLRRLAVMTMQKLLDSYTQDLWIICEPTLRNCLLQTSGSGKQNSEREVGVLLIGIIYYKMEDHFDFLEQALPIIVSFVKSQDLPNILRCTSLWSLQKIASLIIRQPIIQFEVETALLECIQQQNEKASVQKGRKFSQVSHTAYSALDEMVSSSEQLPQRIKQIIQCIEYGIRNCYGRSLYSVLKICSTLYQRHSHQISQEITVHITERLCQKWASNSDIQSIMCPILECLVTISSGKPTVFAKFGLEIFNQTVNLLMANQRMSTQKAILLRCIDLISTLVSLGIPQITSIISSYPQFHQKVVYPLLMSEDREIKHFGYGLIGDICRKNKIPNFAQTYLDVIANNFDKNNLTTCSNALTCLTDLILAHLDSQWASKYSRQTIALAIQKLCTNNLHPAYAFNFARIYGRLGAAFPQEGAAFLLQGLKPAAIALRANETQKLTNDSFRGMIMMVQVSQNPCVEHFEYLAESFICYKSEDPSLQHKFQQLLMRYKSNAGKQGWNSFLRKSNFLPAVSRKIQALCI